MARGGINKALVQQAREALIQKGQSPSIDAVRIELGNTGSKTTIHRYLKEIEEEEGTRLDDQALLSNTIKDFVSQLAARLREEANTVVENATQLHGAQLRETKQSIAELEKQLAGAQQRIAELDQLLSSEKDAHTSANQHLQQLTIQNERFQQQIDDLTTRLDERDKHIQSLEDKHTHAREALEHYRNSVKEQREQDQRRHEHQVQQVQAEMRKLSQDLIVKQDKITQLHQDNARLASEFKESQKRELKLNSALQKSEKEAASLLENNVRLESTLVSMEKEHQKATQEFENLKAILALETKERQALEVAVAKAQSDAEAKAQIIKEYREQMKSII